MRGNDDTSVNSQRRRVLATVAALGVGSVAGCAQLLGGGVVSDDETPEPTAESGDTPPETPTDTPTASATQSPTATPTATATSTPAATPTPTPQPSLKTGFEDGLQNSGFTDTSQADSKPSVSTTHSFEGERSLVLESDPGTSSRNSVESELAVSGPRTARTAVKLVEHGGPENGATVRFLDSETDASLGVSYSEWFSERPRIVEKDTAGEKVGTHVAPATFPRGEWTTVSLRVEGPEELTVGVGDETTTVATELDWTKPSVRVELKANAWGNGHAITAAYDAVEFGPL